MERTEKIILEQFSFDNVVEELIKDMYGYNGSIYRIILKIIPTNSVILKWEDNNTKDSFIETIETEHIRYIAEEEFNHSLYITGTATVTLELRNRLG